MKSSKVVKFKVRMVVEADVETNLSYYSANSETGIVSPEDVVKVEMENLEYEESDYFTMGGLENVHKTFEVKDVMIVEGDAQ